MASAPSHLPISSHKPVTTKPSTTKPAAGAAQPIPVDTPAVRSFFYRVSSSLFHSFSQRRPWGELADRSTLSRPESISEAASRMRKNCTYFRVNYTAVIAAVIAFSLFSHPFSLFVLLCLIAAWLFLYLFRPANEPVFLFGRTFADREILGILIVSTIVIVFLTNVGSLMISSFLVGLGIVGVHGAFRVPDDLFVDDQEPANAGLLSFLGGAASSAAAAAAPTIPRA